MKRTGIPTVRRWRVRYYHGGEVIAETVISTINRRFARWLANERCGYPAIRSDAVTVSLAGEHQ